jgi:hypothetical protein
VAAGLGRRRHCRGPWWRWSSLRGAGQFGEVVRLVGGSRRSSSGRLHADGDLLNNGGSVLALRRPLLHQMGKKGDSEDVEIDRRVWRD